MHSTDRLARHLATWKAWYAIPASLTLLVTSLIPAIAGGFLDPDAPSTKTVMAILIPVQFIAFAAPALSFIALFAIALSALAFALPHLGGSLTGRQAIAYMITGCVFGVVYVLTGSITAAMVSHALQSWVTYAQILYFGHGDSTVHPLLWILVLGCPVWVYLVARLLRAVFPDRTATGAAFGTAAGTSGDRTT